MKNDLIKGVRDVAKITAFGIMVAIAFLAIDDNNPKVAAYSIFVAICIP